MTICLSVCRSACHAAFLLPLCLYLSLRYTHPLQWGGETSQVAAVSSGQLLRALPSGSRTTCLGLLKAAFGGCLASSVRFITSVGTWSETERSDLGKSPSSLTARALRRGPSPSVHPGRNLLQVHVWVLKRENRCGFSKGGCVGQTSEHSLKKLHVSSPPMKGCKQRWRKKRKTSGRGRCREGW